VELWKTVCEDETGSELCPKAGSIIRTVQYSGSESIVFSSHLAVNLPDLQLKSFKNLELNIKILNIHILCPSIHLKDGFAVFQNWMLRRITGYNRMTCRYIKKLRGLVRQRTIPNERPPLVGEVSANFTG
jgi:hypothetical protein